MTNQLIHETSPYLLQHAENPVNWFPWNQQALQLARDENKPIFLSIGYAACHWCHVMAHESFEDPKIAALLNQSFISIKVDREERPDIDSLYMNAVVAMTGQGGWPMSVFLTPDGKPFFGGTYFPPTRGYGQPAFQDVLTSVARSWQEAPDEITPVAEKLARHLQESSRWGGWESQPLRNETLTQALEQLDASYDWQNGGWGQAPKFPAPITIEFLLQQASRGDGKALRLAEHALQSMALGGMYDVVGGGFHRYSTDATWLVPHFEKMLYDNAQLALAYLHAYQLTGDAQYKRISEQTLDFMLGEFQQPEGGFSSSLDADSDGEEGSFYIWQPADLEAAFEQPEDREFLKRAFLLSPYGNFNGKVILRLALPPKELAARLNLNWPAFTDQLDRIRARLYALRQSRVRPALDDKVLVFWNALAIRAFAEAGKVLNRQDYLFAAQKSARFLLTCMVAEDGTLLRSWRRGKAQNTAYLEDHAGLSLALLALYQADFDPKWYQAAQKTGEAIKAHFSDPAGGFFDTHAHQDALLVRPKDLQDNATPSGNSLSCLAFAQLAKYSGDARWTDACLSLLSNLQDMMARYPNAFSAWLQCLSFSLGPIEEIALVWPENTAEPMNFLSHLRQTYRPFSVQAAASLPLKVSLPRLLEERTAINQLPTVYICENFTCHAPLTDFTEFQQRWSGKAQIEKPA